jgi:hypothetical protein
VFLVNQIDNAGQTLKDYEKERNNAIQNADVNDGPTKQKALFAAEETLEGVVSPGVMRTDEWRYTKDLPSERQEIEVTVEESGNPGEAKQKCCRFRKLKRFIQKIFPPCRAHSEVAMIKGVNEGTEDVWTRNIAVLNTQAGNCSPISATMILRYHGFYNKSLGLYQEGSVSQRTWPFNYKAEWWYGWGLPLAYDLKMAMKTSDEKGTYSWNMAHGIRKVLAKYNVQGDASWLVFDYASSSHFERFRSEVERNQPPMVSIIGNGGWVSSFSAGHTMPVLGTKREYHSGTCIKALERSKHWLYVHSTWSIGGKRWYRFDWYNYPTAVWDGIAVNVS